MERFVISDTHFAHENCYKFLNFDGTKMRPWNSSTEADEYMIEQWNIVVKPQDKIYHLGDVGFKRNEVESILKRLNGHKILIKGNHDIFKLAFYSRFFEDIRGCYNFEGLIMTHIPVHPESKNRFKLNLHGHLHYNLVEQGKDRWYRNCCVERNEYKPIPLDEILKEVE